MLDDLALRLQQIADEERREAGEALYMQGHNDTVEGQYGDPQEVANDYLNPTKEEPR